MAEAQARGNGAAVRGRPGRLRARGPVVLLRVVPSRARDQPAGAEEPRSPRSSARPAAARRTLLRCFNRMNDLIAGAASRARSASTARTSTRRRRPGRGAAPDRHGLPAAEPVPQEDLRQRRLRPARRRATAASMDELVERRSAARRSGTRSRTSSSSPARRSRAASSSGSASPGRIAVEPGGDPDGRAVLGARPDRDAADRGADARAQARTTRSSSSPTTCSRRRASRTTPPS